MGKDAAPAPTPDPLIGQAAANNVELGHDALAFSKEQYADSKVRQEATDALTNKVAQSALDSQDLANQWATQDRQIQEGYRTKFDAQSDADRAAGIAAQDKLTGVEAEDKAANAAAQSRLRDLDATNTKLAQDYEQTYGKEAQYQSTLGKEQVGRYNTTFAPVEDKVASDAMNWDSADRQAQMAGEAKADAMAAGQQAQDASTRAMTSMGVNPNSGRFAATNQANSTAVALAAAGAQNTARNNVRTQGVQLRQQASQLGQQVLGSGQQANSLSMTAAQAAQAARQQGLSNSVNLTNTGLQLQQQGTTNTMNLTNQGLAARGIGNTTASLGLSNQGAGYTGLGTGLSAGGAATGANAAGNAYNASSNNAMMNGFTTAGGLNSSGAGIANSLYGNQLNAWGQQQQANGQAMSGIGSAIGTGASLYLL